MKSGEIKQIIKDSGLTISAISRKIGVSRETIYEWIKNPDKYSDKINTVLRVLDDPLKSNVVKDSYNICITCGSAFCSLINITSIFL